jgi:hypothetical protein
MNTVKFIGMAAPFYFITRLPFSYNETDRVVAEAVHANQWQEIGILASSRPTPKGPAPPIRHTMPRSNSMANPFRDRHPLKRSRQTSAKTH